MAGRDSRTYIRLHDGMPDHPKIEGLTDGAFRLLISTWCWCSRHLTDGRVPDAVWRKRGTAKQRAELVTVGLVSIVHDGYVLMHDYLEHQRSAADVEAAREQRRTAGKAGGQAKAKRTAKRVASDSSTETPSETEAKPKQRQRTETELVPIGTSLPPGGADAPADVGAIVGTWVDAVQGTTGERPANTLVARVGRQVRTLIAEGKDPQRVTEAARQAGIGGWDDIGKQLLRMGATGPQHRPSTTDQRVAAGLELAARYGQLDAS